ncbi:hypothetical protein GCM10023194_09100 [Planotetraspora phitsanulokensis]|uniref:DUF1345 domain-containing protein n=1 Tax=Planotetraspora phitsanulokensis TaxID=575192 RepID=A0A8J3TZ90_9ACTN|nr:DUF1345 domain-containing protein [Planotetraspora phitsanulokensis]GII35334.1 hypothetical protein Pph01_03370 [Planotetraspora phitsanulokensis]
MNSENRLPVWLRETEAEGRWTAAAAVIAVIAIHVVLRTMLDVSPLWLMPALESALLVGLIIANPVNFTRESRFLRAASLTLIGVISAANAWIIVREVARLVGGHEHDAARLLATGAGVWIINVLLFALWYWELDRGGPVARSKARCPYPDFLFPQMSEREVAPPDWRPTFTDYLYLAFTNATAFSPTDVMPLSRWAKMVMLVQSATSLVVVALVIARAINVLT